MGVQRLTRQAVGILCAILVLTGAVLTGGLAPLVARAEAP